SGRRARVQTRRPQPIGPRSAAVDRGDADAVLRIGLFVRADDDWALLAVADRANPAGRDAQGHQHALDRRGAALAERQVVLAGAALVAVALDRHGDVRIPLQPLGLA